MRQRGVSGHRRFFVLGRTEEQREADRCDNCSTARDQKQSFEINVPSQAPTSMKPNLPSDPELDARYEEAHGEFPFVQSSSPGTCERLPAQTTLRTVRESFPSHGSSLSKDTPIPGVPQHDGKRGIMKTHLNHIGQLGNTGLRPFTLLFIGRELRDAPTIGIAGCVRLCRACA